MYCKECGKELKQTDAFCIICGAPTGINNDIAGNIFANSQGDRTVPAPKKKSFKKFLIVGVAALIVIGILITIFVANRFSPQRKLIDDYFEAINDKDVEKIYDIGYADELAVGLNTYEVEKLFFFTNYSLMGFSRGLYEIDAFKFVDCVSDTYSNNKNDYNIELSQDRALDDLEVSYKVLDIQPIDEFKLNAVTNLEETRVDIKELESIVSRYNRDTGEKIEVDIEEAYVAQVKVEWEYFDNPYGMMKSWWKDKDFTEFVSSQGFEQFESYDSAIDHMESINGKDKVYILVLYKVDGQWYIYHADRLNTLSTQYQKGEATLLMY